MLAVEPKAPRGDGDQPVGPDGTGGEARGGDLAQRPLPLYCQLEQVLRAQIESGQVLPGQRLPTELELSRRHRMSRATVRQALAALVSEGLLYRRQGKGTFLTEKVRQAAPPRASGFPEDPFQTGQEAALEVLEVKRAPAPERVARLLEVAPGSEVVRVKRIRRAAGAVLSFMVDHVLPEYGDRIAPRDLSQHPMLRVLHEKVGVRLGSARHAVEARKADPEVAGHLEISPLEPVLYVESLVRSAAGRPVEVVDSYFRPDRYRYTVDVVWDPPPRPAPPAPR